MMTFKELQRYLRVFQGFESSFRLQPSKGNSLSIYNSSHLLTGSQCSHCSQYRDDTVFLKYFSFSSTEMFRTLDKKNQGKIQLDLQQVKLCWTSNSDQNTSIQCIWFPLHQLVFLFFIGPACCHMTQLPRDIITELFFSSCSGSALPSTDGHPLQVHAGSFLTSPQLNGETAAIASWCMLWWIKMVCCNRKSVLNKLNSAQCQNNMCYISLCFSF